MKDNRNTAERWYAFWLLAVKQFGGPYRNPHAYTGTRPRHVEGGSSRQQRRALLNAEVRRINAERRERL